VDDSGSADYEKIQDAIDNVSEGYSIIVKDGVYNERLSLDKSINLVAEGKDRAIITSEMKPDSIFENIILINADKCSITGFNISCSNQNGNLIGINIESSGNIIQDNIIRCPYKGIFLNQLSKNNKISRNSIFNSIYGIEIDRSEANEIFENYIRSCEVNGIYIYGGEKNLVYKNNLTKNKHGMQVKGGERNEISKNAFVKNEFGILLCCSSRNNVVFNNNFIENFNWSARDDIKNQWDNGKKGNYWDDYEILYPEAVQIDGIWSIPYNITGLTDDNKDNFPLVSPYID
jgi:nitrous oxidase accessory protein